MRRVFRTIISGHPAGTLRLASWFCAAVMAAGCGGEAEIRFKSVSDPPTVRLMRPPRRDIVRVVGQPSFIESYEQTSIYPKLTAYIEKWNVDIGDLVKKGDTLATLFVPEVVEDFGTKNATVELDRERIELARKMVDVADANVSAAAARVAEAKSILGKYEAEIERWDSEVNRLSREVQRAAVAPQILLESTNQLKASTAARDAARATIMTAEADLASRQAAAAKARVDVAVASKELTVAESDARRLKAWVGYLTLTAPYDGVIVARNANTGDFVLPATGDPTAMSRAPDLSTAGAAPIYVVDRLDVVRIFVDIPEQDANYVRKGARASVLVRAFRDQPLEGTVTRTSWALNVKSRTLRAEIDLPNPGSELLPGMYAYAKVIIDRPGVRALPLSALIHSGDQTFCLVHRDGRAVRTEIQTAVDDGEWIEVTNRRTASAESATGGEGWAPIDGAEEVILGDLSIIGDGDVVKVAPAATGSKVADAPAAPAARLTVTSSAAAVPAR
jgi:multidrug efflux pump subunit AcrA (membrane-fusion protein)